MKARPNRKKPSQPKRSDSESHAPRSPITRAALAECAVFDLAAEAMAVFEMSGRLVDANEMAAGIWGYSRRELQTLAAEDLIVPDQHALLESCRHKLDGDEPTTLELINRRKDGSTFPAEIRCRLLALDGERCILMSLRDLAEQKQARKELADSEARFRNLLEHIPGISIQGYDPDGTVRYWNKASEKVYGYTAEETIGKDLGELIIPDDIKPLYKQGIAMAGKLTESGQFAPPTECELKRKDGSLVPVYSIHTVVCMEDKPPLLFCIDVDLSERKKVEEALRASEERYRLHFENIGDIVCSIDSDLTLTSISPSIVNVLDYRPEEIVGRKVGDLEILSPGSLPEVLADVRTVLSGTPVRMAEYEFIAKDGSPRLGEVSGTPMFRNGKVTEMVVVARDITERKTAEKALRESKREMEMLLSNLPGMAFRCKNDEHRTMQFASRGCFALTGYQPEDLINNAKTSYGELVHPDDRKRIRDEMQEYLALKKPLKFIYRIRTRKGKTKWVLEHNQGRFDPNGRLLALEGIILDISQRRQAEEELSEAKKLLSRTFASLDESVLIIDPTTSKVIRYNKAADGMFGYPLHALAGRTTEILHVDHEQYERFQSDAAKHLTQDGFYQTEYRMRRKNGEVFISHNRLAQIHGQLGDKPVAVLVVRDITELRNKEEQLRQAQKMEAIGKLAGGIAHDFKNQLTVVKGYADLLLKDLPAASPHHEAISEILKAAQRAGGLTEQLLAYGRKQTLHPKFLNLNTILKDMTDLLRSMLGDKIDIRVHLAADLHEVLADPIQVQQTIMNIVDNASDAMPKGGQLTLETANRQIDPRGRALHPEAPAGPLAMVAISDNGIGMDEATQKQLFDPFFTTKDVGEGTGLGLSIVYGFVKQSGGYIDVQSTPGAGTTFRIYLPRAKARGD